MDDGLISGAIIAAISTVVLQLVFPLLTAIAVGFCIGYRELRSIETYANNFNLLTGMVIAVYLISVLFSGFSPLHPLSNLSTPAMNGLWIICLLMGGVKALFMIPGKRLGSTFFNPQTNAAVTAAKGKSLLGIITALVNVQSIGAFAVVAVAIIPLTLLDVLLNGIFDFQLESLLVFFGMLSLAAIAIIVDVIDRVVQSVGKARQVISGSEEEQEQSRESGEAVSRTFYAELDEELPPPSQTGTVPENIAALSSSKFEALVLETMRRDAATEGYDYSIHEYGDTRAARVASPSDEIIIAIVADTSEQIDNLDVEQVRTRVTEHLASMTFDPHIFYLAVPTAVGIDLKIRCFQYYDVALIGPELLSRMVEEYNVEIEEINC